MSHKKGLHMRTQSNTIIILLKLLGLSSLLIITNPLAITHLAKFIQEHEIISTLEYACMWVSAIIALVYVFFHPSLKYRLSWGAIITFSTLIEYISTSIAGENISITSLTIMLNETAQAQSLFSTYASYIFIPIIAAIPWIVIILLQTKHNLFPKNRKYRLLFRAGSYFPIITILLITYSIHVLIGRTLWGLPIQFSGLSQLINYTLSANPFNGKRDLPETILKQPPTPHKQNIVLIVDESIRGDFIDLNHNQHITPFMLKNKDKFINFGIAASGNNCSSNSNYILRTGGIFKQLTSTLSNPYIWQYAKKAGYKTILLDLQNGTRLVNFLSSHELNYIDKQIPFKPIQDETYRDIVGAEQIKQILKSSKSPVFLYVVKHGAHFNYIDKYPNSETQFTPTLKPNETLTPSSRKRMLNTYKNAVRWSVDHFFETLFSTAIPKNTTIIYTSDHGQNLLDVSSHTLTHCKQSSPYFMEGAVPLLIHTNIETIGNKFKQASIVNQDKVSHFEIYPTLLSLMGYDPQEIRNHYGTSLLDKITHPRQFSSGEIRSKNLTVWTALPNITELTLSKHATETNN